MERRLAAALSCLSTRVEVWLNPRYALSAVDRFYFLFLDKFESDRGGIRTHGPTLIVAAFEGNQ